MKFVIVVAVLSVLVSTAFYFFEAWATANPPNYSESLPDNMFVLMLQGFAVRRRTESRMAQIADDFFKSYGDDGNPTKSKNIILTGSTSGLGFGTATRLIAAGGFKTLFLPCRKGNNDQYVANFRKRLLASATELVSSLDDNRKATGVKNIENGMKHVQIMAMDLASLDSVDNGVAEIKKRLSDDSIDILINNAGLVNIYGGKTADGFEKAFGVNYLGTAYFTEKVQEAGLLSEFDLKGDFPRVIMVTSEEHRMHRAVKLKNQTYFGDFYDFGLYTGGQMKGYAYSKFLLTTYSHELSRRWKHKARIFDICPGPVSSDIAGDAPWPVNHLVVLWMKYSFVSAIEAALPLLNVGFYKHAENRQDDTAKPLVHFHMGEERPASKESQYEANGSILWSLTHKLFKNRKPLSASQ